MDDILEERCLDTVKSFVLAAGYFSIAGQSDRWTRSKKKGRLEERKTVNK